MMPKYRLLKETSAAGIVYWKIQRRFILWWEPVDLFLDESQARKVFADLRCGAPVSTTIVINET